MVIIISITTTFFPFIPACYHADVKSLLYYLASFPYGTPRHCPHCGSATFYDNSDRHSRIRNFRCKRCRKGFNQLTGTPFSGTRHLELWPIFAELRLAGDSLPTITRKLAISSNAATHRDRALHKIMAEDYPELSAWWIPHQARLDDVLSPAAQAEWQQFQSWLHDLMNRQSDVCPHCGSNNNSRQSERPSFRCRPCDRTFNVLKGTPLDKLSQITQWPDFVAALVRGESDTDMHRQFGLCTATYAKRRQRFIQVIQQQGLHVLAEWIMWQRQRRYVQVLAERQES